MAAATQRKGRYGEDRPFYESSSPTLLAEVPVDPQEKPGTSKEQREWEAVFEHCEQRLQALWTWRLPWWQTWGQIARYMLPRRYFTFVINNVYSEGRRQDFDIVDRTGTLAGELCASGLMAGLTDPDRQWLTLGPGIPGLELDQAGQQWYEDVTERLNYVYTHSNFYEAQAQHYEDLVFFGTAPVVDYADEEKIINVRTPCAGEYMLGTGFDFSDEVFYEEFKLTVSQIVEGFGAENCPADVLQMWRQKGGALEYQYVIGHAIEPNFAVGQNPDDEFGVVAGGFTWREVYWIRGKKNTKPLSVAGFHEQPFATSRWNTRGNDAYGRGVGENMLGDVIQLQLETRQKAESIEKVNRPPMGADVSLQNLPTSTNPGKITYFNTGASGEKKFFPLFEIRPDIGAITADISLIQERIRKTAYNDVMQPMEDLRDQTKTQITATEIDAIKEERLLPLGPVFGRVYSALRTRVRRHLAIMARRGLIPPKPPSLRGVPTKIDFISMLTAAQKATRTQAIARTFQFAGTISGAYPEAKFALDPVEGIREFNDGVGGSSKIVRSPAQVQQMIQQMDQQNAAAQAMAQTAQGAQAAAALGKTSLAPGNALSALVGGPI